MAAGPRGALGTDVASGLDQEHAPDRAVAGAHRLRAGQERDRVDLPARDSAEVGTSGEWIVDGEPVDQHEHLVRPAAAHLRRGRPVSGAPDDDAFPAVERTREIAAPALELRPADRDPSRGRRGGDAVEPYRERLQRHVYVRSSPGNSSSTSRAGV